MTRDGEILAILFRHDRSVDPITLGGMFDNHALRGHPQSIARVQEEGEPWLRLMLGA